MHPILIGCGAVPRNLVSQRVKVPPVPFTRQTFFRKETLIKETKLVFDKTFLKNAHLLPQLRIRHRGTIKSLLVTVEISPIPIPQPFLEFLICPSPKFYRLTSVSQLHPSYIHISNFLIKCSSKNHPLLHAMRQPYCP